MQGVPAQFKSCPEQDHNQSDLSKVGGYMHHLRSHEPEKVRPYQYTNNEHSHQPGKLELAENYISGQPKDHN